MNTQIQQDERQRPHIFQRVLELAHRYYEQEDNLPPGRYVADIPFEDLPNKGKGALNTLNFFDERYSSLIPASAGPRYFAFVTGGSTPAAVAGDWLVSVYDQNACGSNDSIAPQLERQTIHYLRQLFGLTEDFYGAFVTGATMSNFVGLAIARQWIGEQHGIDVSNDGIGEIPIKIVSGTPHSSILKSMSMLGIGKRALKTVDVLPNREAVDLQKLEDVLASEEAPVIVVANAGTVNTGDFDDLAAIAELKKKYNFWLHVDGAFGGFAASSEKFRHLMDGVLAADSVTVDAHKWLNVPYDAAMQFTRHPKLQLKIFQNSAAYLTDPAKSSDFFHYTPESSRRWRALPAWFTLHAYGRDGYSEIVERNCALASQLGELIQSSDEFRLLSQVRLNIVCFTLAEDVGEQGIRNFLSAVRDRGEVYLTPTTYKGIPAIRAAISNWQTQPGDIERAFQSMQKSLNELRLANV